MTGRTASPTQAIFDRIDETVAGVGFVSDTLSSYLRTLQQQSSSSVSLSEAISHQLLAVDPGQPILLFTGFVVPDRYPFGENDGPLGTIALARALARCGRKPEIWVDDCLLDTVQWLGAEIRLACPIRRIDSDIAKRLPDAPSAAIAIEKPGINEHGILHTFDGLGIRGGSLSVDGLFDDWTAAGLMTLGIGDRGNEVGFGRLRQTILSLRPERARCDCGCEGSVLAVSETQYLYPAAVSNWGAYGLIAALAMRLDDNSLLLTPQEEERLLHVAAVRGCVDGVKRRGGYGVDGIAGQTSVSVVRALGELVANRM